jgi:hypothetical protein
MKKLLPILISLIVYAYSCNTTSHDKRFPKEVACNYIAMTIHDSTSKRFTWDSLKELPAQHGPVIFQWKTDSSLIISYAPRTATLAVEFSGITLTEEEQKKIPSSLLDNKFILAGVYENNDYKNTGLYYVIYIYQSQVLVQIRQTLDFLMDVIYYTNSHENLFQKDGYVFPYYKSIRF